MKPVFYKSRDGKYYTKLTKNEIKKSIAYDNPSTYEFLLRDMDYLYLKDIWDLYSNIDKYIGFANAYSSFGYEDSAAVEETIKKMNEAEAVADDTNE